MQEAGKNPTIYYTNSNIHPASEYERRLDTLQEWAGKGEIYDPELTAPVDVIEGTYDPQIWESACGAIGDAAIKKAQATLKENVADKVKKVAKDTIVDTFASDKAKNTPSEIVTENAPSKETSAKNATPVADKENSAPHTSTPHTSAPYTSHSSAFHEAMAGGAPFEAAITLAVDPKMRLARCRACYRIRFEEVAKYAAAHGFDSIGTTLSISPYQYTQIIREELERAAATHNLRCAFQDYSPCYARATQRSRDIGMYRQNFCGCRISDLEAQAERAQRKYQRKQKKLARKMKQKLQDKPAT